MKTALILIAVLAISGCSTVPKSYGSFRNGEPCVYVAGRSDFICKAETTPEQQLAWYEAHYVQPYLDEREKQAIALCKPASAADIGTTFVALTACSAVELNPLFAGMGPGAIVIVNGAASYLFCRYFEEQAEQSPRALSTANSLLLYDAVRGLAAFHNATTLASCL